MTYERAQITVINPEERIIDGYAVIWGIPCIGIDPKGNAYPEIIQPGAFRDSIKSDGPQGWARIKFCVAHKHRTPIGKILELKEDESGLFFRAYISKTSYGNDVLQLIQDEVYTECSTGSFPIDSPKKKINGHIIHNTTKAHLIEISVVAQAAQKEARITKHEASHEDLSHINESIQTIINVLKG